MIVKSIAKPAFHLLFTLLPQRAALGLVGLFPRTAGAFPAGRKITFRKYLGDLTLNIYTDYLLERGMLSGQYDPQTLSIIDRFVKPGFACLDIGANIGAITLALSKKLGKTGKVYAFEPGEPTYSRLRANIQSNPSFKGIVECVNSGVSSEPTTLYWVEAKGQGGNGQLFENEQPGSKPIPVTTVDAFFARKELPKLDFVKIDVETMEYEVLKGGQATWRKHQPFIYYESIKQFEDQKGSPYLKHAQEFLTEMGYELFKVGPNAQLAKAEYPDITANTLAIPTSRKDQV